MSIPRIIPPLRNREEFVHVFVTQGWRGIERLYGHRDDLLLKYIEMCGGQDLKQRRRDHMKANGTGVYGRAGGNGARPRGVDVEGWLG